MEFRIRDYGTDESRMLLQREPCFQHPLLGRAGEAQEAPAGSSEAATDAALDLNQVVDDPLRQIATSMVDLERHSDGGLIVKKRNREISEEEQERAAEADWEGKKAAILQRFTPSGSIAVTSSLDIVTQPGRGRLTASQRLEQLEHPQAAGQAAGRQVAQLEVVARLRELNADLSQAWLAAERLTALRLAIKVARLLLDTGVPPFYPTLFVLATDCLDTVGGLVWTRIMRKAEDDESGGPRHRLPVGFTWRDVPPAAQETCRNWFHKVGAIPELLPRVYLELALLRCYHFLEPAPPVAALTRLSAMIRGLTEPLAAAYAQLYLARRMAAVAPKETGPLVAGLHDRVRQYRHVLAGHHDASLQRTAITRTAYLQLLDPPLEFTLETLLKDAPLALLSELLTRFAPLPMDAPSPPGGPPLAVMVLHLVAHLPGPFVADHAHHLTRVIATTTDASAKQASLFCALYRRLAQTPPPSEQLVAILNDTWKVVARSPDISDYLAVADLVLDFVLRHFGLLELDVLLRDVVRHLHGSAPPDAALATLEHLMDTLLASTPLLPPLLTLPQLGSLLGVFQGDGRVAVSRRLLEAATSAPGLLEDPACLPLLLEAARALHDAVDPATPDEACRPAARLLCRLIHKVSPGWPAEQHLRFLGDCRAAWCNLDVQGAVVHAALRLAVSLHSNSSSQDLVRACLAFCAVTLPAVAPPLLRLHLTLATAEVALRAGALLHAEGALQAAIAGLSDVHTDAEAGDTDAQALLAAVSKLANLLALNPGPPEAGPLPLFHTLLATLEALPGFPLGRAVCSVLPALSCLIQPRLPAPMRDLPVPSALYCGEAAYQADLARLASNLTSLAVAETQAGRPEAQARLLAQHLRDVLLLVFQPGIEIARTCSVLQSVFQKRKRNL